MSCPLCGAPPREGSLRCPQCGWASPEALAAQEGLPLYGESSPSPSLQPRPAAGPTRRGRRGLLVAVAALAVIVVVGVAVSALTGRRSASADVLDTGERVDLPAGVERQPEVAWQHRVEAMSLIGVGGTVVVSQDDGVVGYSAGTGERRWRLPAAGDGTASVTQLGDGRRVVVQFGARNRGDGDLHVVVVDADDGRVRWRYTGPRAEFATRLDERHVGVVSTDRAPARGIRLTVLSSSDGTQEWTANGYPLALGEHTVYLVDDQRLVAADLETGEEQWNRDISSYDRAENLGAVAVGDTVVLARSDTAVVGLSATDGTFLWSHALARPVVAVRSAGDLVVATSQSDAVGIDPTSGEQRWEVTSDAWREYPYVQLEGHDDLYALGRGVARLDPKSGHSLADATGALVAGDYYVEPSAIADGMVYLPHSRRELQALDARTLEVRWSLDLDENLVALAAADHTVVITTDDELVAYR